MKSSPATAVALLLCLGVRVSAHRLDEYLQASLLTITKDRVEVSMRLVPGVAALPAVLAAIDTDHDGLISQTEEQEYARQVLRDLSLSVDGRALTPQLLSADYPAIQLMKQGLGEIHIRFSAALPEGGATRSLILENRHQSRLAAYLVNCLLPRDRDLRVLTQRRNRTQSHYELDYTQANSASHLPPAAWWVPLIASLGNLNGFGNMFALGMHHIAAGTDHLLFLLALLLPAPLYVARSHWGCPSGLRQSITRILQVVTAFTVGHSLTLAIAASGFLLVPGRPVEVLIAVSILVSALHALRPIFPGREPLVAGCFGLIHGLAFAATLGQLGIAGSVRLANILAFNLGIETMQLLVVAAVMPSLLLLSRTLAYSAFRIAGALFAMAASLGWIAERLLNVQGPVDALVNVLSARAIMVTGLLFVASLACWVLRYRRMLTAAPSLVPSSTFPLHAPGPSAPNSFHRSISTGRD